MKGSKVLFVIMAVAMVTLGLSGISYAFHDGGVAVCDSCHTMHNAQGTAAMGKGSLFSGNAFLLQGTDQSSTCLNCHGSSSTGSYHEYTLNATTATIPLNYSPGGDFGWLQIVPASGATSTGNRRGHNIVAADYGLTASTVFTTAPGNGTQNPYPANNFYCSSCHDPHGTYRHTGGDPGIATDIKSSVFTTGGAGVQTVGSGSYGQTAVGQNAAAAGEAVGVYRLLGGANYLPQSVSASASKFINNSPIAEAPSTYNVSEGVFNTTSGTAGKGGASAELIVSYGSGMSEWCANCHQAVLQTNAMGNFIHPAGASATLGVATVGTQTLAANYVSYIGSGNLGGSNLYTSLIPVENGSITTGATSFGAIAPTVTGSSNVMCLTCHRAHASGWQNMTRWDNTTELITNSVGYAAGHTPAYSYNTTQYNAAYNGRPYTAFVLNQRSLCNKCHAKD